MNEFEYIITQDVYNGIVSGKKKIEIRLYNEKSSKININDYITFKVLDNDSISIRVKVVALLRYKNITDLLMDINPNLVMYNYPIEKAEELLGEIFGIEKVKTHDVIGIKFELEQGI